MSTPNSSRKGLNFGLIGLGIAFIGLVIALIVFLIKRQKEKNSQNQNQNTNDYITEVDTKPNKATQKQIFKQIYEAALNYGFGNDGALTIAAVSAHETGRWGSRLANEVNNIFGMKDGGAGLGIQSGVSNGYASYDNLEDSLRDHVELLKKRGYPFADNLTPEQHLQFMKSKKYFEAPLEDYKRSVLSLLNELRP